MPLTVILRWTFSLLSVAILIAAVWLCWDWYYEEAYWSEDGRFHLTLVDWRLALGALLLLSSFLGRFFWLPLLARPDHGEPSDPTPRAGETIPSPTGAKLHVQREGAASGHALLFTHGWAMDSTMWSYARKAFGKRHPIVTWDLAGLGRSTEPGSINLDQMADDLLTIVDRIDQPVVLIGHSIGGMTIQTLAKRRPDLFDGRRVVGVVLINTTYTNPLATMILPRLALALRPVLEVLLRLQIWLLPLTWLSAWQSYLSGSAHMANRILHGPRVTRSQLNHTSLCATRNSPAVIAKGDLAMFRWDATDALKAVRVPVLVLGGEHDIATKPIASEWIATETPTSTLRIIPSANHMSLMDEVSAYHREMDQFFDTLAPVKASAAT